MANTELKALEPFLAVLATKQQKGTKINLKDTHALNIFNGAFVDFRPRPAAKNKAQRFAWDDVDAKSLAKLANEILGKVPEQKNEKNFSERLRNNRESRSSAIKNSPAKKVSSK